MRFVSRAMESDLVNNTINITIVIANRETADFATSELIVICNDGFMAKSLVKTVHLLELG